MVSLQPSEDCLPSDPCFISRLLVSLVGRQGLLIIPSGFFVSFFVALWLGCFRFWCISRSHKTVAGTFIGYRVILLPQLLHHIDSLCKCGVDARVVSSIKAIDR